MWVYIALRFGFTCLTGSHKVGLMGLVLVPFSTLKMNWKKHNKTVKLRGNKGRGQLRLMCTQRRS